MSDRPSDPADAGSRLVVGLVRGLHGLRGMVRLEILTDDPARFEPGSVLYPEGSDHPLTIADAHTDGPGMLIRFRERPDRESVEDLRDRYLEAVAPTEPLPDGTFYWHQLTGLRAIDLAGADLGRVVDVFRAGGGEVLVVEGPRGELMIPAVSAVVRELSPAEGRVVVDTEALGLDESEPRSRVRGRRTTRARKAAERDAGAAPAVHEQPDDQA
jgi:16S rRNA processing protein RimM